MHLNKQKSERPMWPIDRRPGKSKQQLADQKKKLTITGFDFILFVQLRCKLNSL